MWCFTKDVCAQFHSWGCEILLQSMKPAITHLLQSGRAFRDLFCNVLCNVYGVSNKMGIATNSTVNRISMHSHDQSLTGRLTCSVGMWANFKPCSPTLYQGFPRFFISNDVHQERWQHKLNWPRINGSTDQRIWKLKIKQRHSTFGSLCKA